MSGTCAYLGTLFSIDDANCRWIIRLVISISSIQLLRDLVRLWLELLFHHLDRYLFLELLPFGHISFWNCCHLVLGQGFGTGIACGYG